MREPDDEFRRIFAGKIQFETEGRCEEEGGEARAGKVRETFKAGEDAEREHDVGRSDNEPKELRVGNE